MLKQNNSIVTTGEQPFQRQQMQKGPNGCCCFITVALVMIETLMAIYTSRCFGCGP